MRKVSALWASACLGLVLSVLGGAGCASHPFRSSGQYEQDQDLADRVRDALSRAPVYRFPDVKVSVYRGKVELSGFVQTDAQRRNATRITAQVQGVSRVDNELVLREAAGSATGGASAPGGGSSGSGYWP